MRPPAFPSSRSSPEAVDHRLVERFLFVSLIFALVAVPGAVLVLAEIDGGWAKPTLQVLVVINALTLWWLWRTAASRSVEESVLRIMGATAVLTFGFVAVEPWLIHFTPMVCLGSLLLPLGLVEPGRYRRLLIGGLVYITSMTIFSRIGAIRGPVMEAAPTSTRDLVAVINTPILFVLVSWILWQGHAAIVDRVDGIAESQRRLVGAEEAGRRTIDADSADLRARLATARGVVAEVGQPADVSNRVGGPDRSDHPDHRLAVAELMPSIRGMSADLRRLSHGIMAPQLVGAASGQTLADLGGLVEWPVTSTIAADLPDLPEVVDGTLRICAAELLRGLDSLDVADAELRLGSDADHVVLAMTYRTLRGSPAANGGGRTDGTGTAPIPAVHTLDRVGALGGIVTTDHREGRGAIEIRIPRRPTEVEPHALGRLRTAADRGLSSALLRASVFPVVGFLVGLATWLFVLPYRDMAEVVVLVAVAYTGPCLAAVVVARRAPRLAIWLFATSHWVTALAVASQFTIIKFFVAAALLIPVVAAMPYLSRGWYRSLVVVSAVVAAVTAAMTRLVDQLEIAGESPQTVNKAIVIVLIPSACAIVLALAWRNHAALVVRAVELRAARRRVVEAIERVRRQIERDLHDGAQQRLVSATLRAQILTRLEPDDRARVEENLRLLDEELETAEHALSVLQRPGDTIATTETLVERLNRLKATSPVPLELHVGRLPDRLAPEAVAALWFCCSEAVGNVAKHAGDGARATIELDAQVGSVRFRVVDDGQGFDWPSSSGRGLRNLADRMGVLGGSLDVTSSAGRGTVVAGSIPFA
ncbi:MAG: ATP-binding protein [Actinomycetota bacterium]